jgi:probable F420-dependent oxidoreductase
VHFGVTMFATDRSMAVHDLAREAEARGYHSLYIPEHTHMPTSRATPPPMGGDTLADEYSRTLDPFVALSAAAAVTERIRLGTGICLIAQHDPIVLAKEVATLDLVSGGRFELGIGFGWNKEEMADHGVEFASRREHAREHLLAMRELWSNDEASFDGRLVRFAPTWSWPKPVQSGGPPVLIGGQAGPKMFAAIAEYADGWIPIGGAGIRSALPDLHRAVEAAGRDPATIRVVPFGTIPDAGKIDYYAALGIDEIVLRLPSAPRDEVVRVLDEYSSFVER